jgi:alpha-L-fucosidase 2
MNYWMAEAAGMPECAEALIGYLERFVPHAQKAARDLYGCRGIVLPLQTDAWGRATPESHGWAVWIGAAPWMAQHVWRHYVYSGDREYLSGRAYPFLREVALFYEDYLVEDESGILHIMPSQSPENRFEGTGNWPVSLGISAAMDVQLAYDALGYAIEASEILEVDPEQRQIWRRMRDSLPPFAIGPDGRLLEWDVPRTETEPGHRHLSHLYGLYPSDLFNPADRPAQYEAAGRALEYRLAQGGGHTGWSRAWVACLMARMGRGAEVWRHLNALLTDFATASLLDLHPPRIFQIDGNLGAAAAVIECLVQCWGGKIHLLRALPPAWPDGRAEKIRVPGGHALSLSWRSGALHRVKIVVGYGSSLVLSGLARRFSLSQGARDIGDDVHITAAPGVTVTLEPPNRAG